MKPRLCLLFANVLTSLALIVASDGFAAAPAPIPVTESAFSALLSRKIAEVPDLVPLWRISKEKGIKVFLAGGGVRALAYFLRHELETKTPGEVEKMAMPKLDVIFLSRSADIDLVVETSLSENEYRAALGEFGEWDITPRPVFENLTAVGGPHIEKTLVNPGEVVDPFHAVGDFVEGKLRIHFAPTDLFYGSKFVKELGITRLSQILRFARMHQEMPTMAVEADTWERLHRIAEEDAKLSNGLSPKQIQRDHRIFRELKKIFLNSKRDFGDAVYLLHEAGALKAVSQNGFYFPFDKTRYDRQTIRFELAKRGLPSAERERAMRMIANRFSPDFAWIRSLFCRYLMTRDAPWNPRITR